MIDIDRRREDRYNALIDDIRYTKRQQWQVTYYILLFNFALVVLLTILEVNNHKSGFIGSFNVFGSLHSSPIVIVSFLATFISLLFQANYLRDIYRYRKQRDWIQKILSKNAVPKYTIKNVLVRNWVLGASFCLLSLLSYGILVMSYYGLGIQIVYAILTSLLFFTLLFMWVIFQLIRFSRFWICKNGAYVEFYLLKTGRKQGTCGQRYKLGKTTRCIIRADNGREYHVPVDQVIGRIKQS
ncbi:MAG: hypothetical protein ACYTA5_25385 [Planctomycetota bacterium]|jgi:uncharacterized integral membrane protein